MIYHVCKLENDANVLIRCSDTDVLIIMLGNMEFVKSEIKIWMQIGLENNQRYINISKLYETLGKNLCLSLPAFHALTGCDFNPAFFRKGKKRSYDILQRSEKYMKAFADLGDFPNCNESVLPTLEEFVCRIYGSKQIKFINEMRLDLFSKAYKFTDNEDLFRINTKNFDASILPPCQSELHQHLT